MALNSTQLTQTNSVMGSVHYLPPEQASGKGCTTKSDIYSMGIIFYELLSGSLPFRGENAVEIALKHMRDPLPSLKEENSAIPQSIENVIMRSTAKNPKNRYEDAKSMHDDLLTVLDDDRMNEEPIKYKYQEHESDATKKIKKVEDIEKDEDEKTEEIATKIEDKKEKKNKKLIIILSIVFGGLLLLLIILFFVVPSLTNKEAVTVPNCKGDKVSVCEKKLQELGFEVNTDIKVVPSTKVKKNRVVKTDPGKGRSIKYGSKITIYKSGGEETFELEDYTGKNYIEVQTILETKYELIVKIEKKEPADNDKEYDEQEIIGQSLAAGSEVKKGDTITLFIPDITDVFPDMNAEGWSLADAEAFCSKYNLTISTKYEETKAYSEGKVISQSRAPGSPIVKGTNLEVTIAKKPVEKEPVKEPEEDDTSSESTNTKDESTSTTDTENRIEE